MARSQSKAWVPILPSSAQGAAWSAVEAVAQAVVEGDCAAHEGRGHRGEDDALLYAYLAAARSDFSWATRATERLNGVIDQAAESGHRWLGLHGGLCGLGWTVEHISRLLDRAFPPSTADDLGMCDEGDGEGDLAAEVDAVVLQQLRHVSPGAWVREYDLIGGLVGYGAYCLERWPAETAADGVRLVIDHLEALAEPMDRGMAWFTGPGLLPEWQRVRYPDGYYNPGVAHGIPGVIHFLGEAAAIGVERERVNRLLVGAVDWLLAQRRPPGSAQWFCSWLAPGDSSGSRFAWCYGDLGILSVLFQVARRAGREDWYRSARNLLDHCLARRPEESGVADAVLCHGAAGVAHIFNRIYQAENDLRCREAALAWFDVALSMRQPGSGAGGFLAVTQRHPEAPMTLEASAAFLDGAIGVALALLSALTPTPPGWDRLLLVSGRAWEETTAPGVVRSPPAFAGEAPDV